MLGWTESCSNFSEIWQVASTSTASARTASASTASTRLAPECTLSLSLSVRPHRPPSRGVPWSLVSTPVYVYMSTKDGVGSTSTPSTRTVCDADVEWPRLSSDG